MTPAHGRRQRRSTPSDERDELRQGDGTEQDNEAPSPWTEAITTDVQPRLHLSCADDRSVRIRDAIHDLLRCAVRSGQYSRQPRLDRRLEDENGLEAHRSVVAQTQPNEKILEGVVA